MAERADPSAPSEGPARAATRLLAAELFCETCGRETVHRILRIDRSSRPGATAIRGTARCRECRWTHPFESVVPREVEVMRMVSEGDRTDRERIFLPVHHRVQVGSSLPGAAAPLLVRRIDTRDGRQVGSAAPEQIATVWTTRDVGAVVRVSVIEGRFTRTARLVVPPETPYAVGERVSVDGTRLEVIALRARGRTWRRPGDAFPAAEVQRLYARRTVIPPAGRRDWRSERGRPSSVASSTSRAGRSRSGPGVRRTRTAPSARTALGGAQVHRSSPA